MQALTYATPLATRCSGDSIGAWLAKGRLAEPDPFVVAGRCASSRARGPLRPPFCRPVGTIALPVAVLASQASWRTLALVDLASGHEGCAHCAVVGHYHLNEQGFPQAAG